VVVSVTLHKHDSGAIHDMDIFEMVLTKPSLKNNDECVLI
jgi:hypothetical protein